MGAEKLLVRIGFCTTKSDIRLDSIDALYAFYRIPKCLKWRNILSWIPFGSDLDPNSDNVVFFFKGERIQISLKAGHHRPMMAQRWMLAWLFWEFQGIRSSIAKGSGPHVPPLDPRMGPDNVYTYWDLLKIYFIVYLHTFYRMHNFLNWWNILSWIPFGSDLDQKRFCKCK